MVAQEAVSIQLLVFAGVALGPGSLVPRLSAVDQRSSGRPAMVAGTGESK
jgi:hypothetical protein